MWPNKKEDATMKEKSDVDTSNLHVPTEAEVDAILFSEGGKVAEQVLEGRWKRQLALGHKSMDEELAEMDEPWPPPYERRGY